MSEKEKKVFNQEVSEEELGKVSGGEEDWLIAGCTEANKRPIYGRGPSVFPNCAATVESGSLCDTNDACKFFAVCYEGMKDCFRAWR